MRNPTHARQRQKRRLRPCSHTDQGPSSKPEPQPTAPPDPGLKTLGEIIASLERARDVHASDLNTQLERLKQLSDFARKAAEITNQKTALKQKGPLTVGGFLVI